MSNGRRAARGSDSGGPYYPPPPPPPPPAAEGTTAILGPGHVRDKGAGRDVGRAAESGEEPARENPADAGRQARDRVVEPEPQHRDQQNRPAAVGVGQIADHGTEQELHRRIGDEQQATERRRGRQVRPRHLADQVRRHGDDEPDADHVDQHRAEHESEAAPIRPSYPDRKFCRWCAHRWRRVTRLSRTSAPASAGPGAAPEVNRASRGGASRVCGTRPRRTRTASTRRAMAGAGST